MTILQKVKNKLFGKPVILTPDDIRLQSLNRILDEGLGHRRSFQLQKPVNADGNPLPWFTYPAIEFLQQLDLSQLSILEWGIGNSSLFFSKRCKTIFSVEHNKEWFDLISGSMPANAQAVLASETEYQNIPYQQNQKFDIIVVDGINRAACVLTAVNLLKETGFIIFDNSERNPELCDYLRQNNLIEIDFHGYGPVNSYTWTTSLFLSRNCNLQPLAHQPVIPHGGGY